MATDDKPKTLQERMAALKNLGAQRAGGERSPVAEAKARADEALRAAAAAASGMEAAQEEALELLEEAKEKAAGAAGRVSNRTFAVPASPAAAGAPRPAPARAPSAMGIYPEQNQPAMNAFLHLSMSEEAPPSTRASIEEMWKTVVEYRQRKVELSTWVPVYAQAIGVVEQTVRELEKEAERLRARLPDPNEPARIQSLFFAGPQAEATQRRTQLLQELRRVTSEWSQRLDTQASTYILPHCLKSGRELLRPLYETDGDSLVLVLPPEVQNRIQEGFRMTGQAWVTDVHPKVMADFQEAVASAGSVALASLRGVTPPSETAPREPRLVEGAIEAPRVEVPMPGWFARAVRSMRGLVMTLTFVGGIAATFLGGVTFVAGLSDKPSASSLLKFLVAAGGVPVAIIAGVVGAEKERQLIRRKAAEKFKKEGETWLKAITNVTMDGYRTRMDTWIAETERDWVDAVGAWWEDVISPAVARAQEAATKRVADHKARSDEIAKQITAVTTLRGKATQVLASLRYRHQELRLGNAQPTPDDEPEPG